MGQIACIDRLDAVVLDIRMGQQVFVPEIRG